MPVEVAQFETRFIYGVVTRWELLAESLLAQGLKGQERANNAHQHPHIPSYYVSGFVWQRRTDVMASQELVIW